VHSATVSTIACAKLSYYSQRLGGSRGQSLKATRYQALGLMASQTLTLRPVHVWCDIPEEFGKRPTVSVLARRNSPPFCEPVFSLSIIVDTPKGRRRAAQSENIDL